MTPQVWLRFEKKKRDGSVMKLRIQDLPPERFGEAADLMVRYFIKDEPIRKAIGFPKNPAAIEEYRNYVHKVFRDPAGHNVMCCADTDDETPDIMGISCVVKSGKLHEVTDNNMFLTAGTATEETKKYNEIRANGDLGFDLIKKLNLSCYYAGKSVFVLPKYRGHSISQQFLTVRRIMCAAHGIPMTGAWMSTHATQIAAKRDGWETYYEIPFSEISRKYGITFEDVPTTMKYVAAGPHPKYALNSTFRY